MWCHPIRLNLYPPPVAPERTWKWGPVQRESGGGGHRYGAKLRKIFLVVPLHFLALKVQLVVFIGSFVMVSTVWSVSCLLFCYSMGGASRVAGGSCLLLAAPCALCPAPGCPPVVVRKNYMRPLEPSRSLSRRKFYVKIHEMCQNTAQSMLNFFLFPVVNGQSTCC